jgi:trigger factor
MPEDTTSAVAEPETDTPDQNDEEQEQKPQRLSQEVEIKDAGPCRKHIKVSVSRTDVDARFKDKFKEQMGKVNVPGFRPGKTPRKLVEKLLYNDVSDQIKGELLLQSLEQLAEDNKLNPIAQPNLDPLKITLPKEGPFTFEFEVEVAPDFTLPNYKGLKLRRPVKTYSEEDINKAQKRLFQQYGELITKDGPAEMEDYLTADVHIMDGGREMSHFDNLQVRLDPTLAFKDGLAENFGTVMNGVKAGDKREVEVTLSQAIADPNLRGRKVTAKFDVKEVKTIKMPELTEEFYAQFGADNETELREKIRAMMQRQLEYEQRRSARQQVLALITESANWDLPRELLERQARRTLQRRIVDMQSSGFTEEQIRAQITLLQQDALASTAKALKEQFVLQRIAEDEKIDVGDEDIELEIETIAAMSDESPRKVRARLERDDMMEALMTQIIERKAIDLILSSAEYEDVPMETEKEVTAVEEAASGAVPEASIEMQTETKEGNAS